MSSSEPRLPLELELEAFTTTARLYPKSIPNLLRVAHRVLTWIEPLLYETLIFSSDNLPHLRYALETKPPTFWSRNVGNLLIPGYLGMQNRVLALSVLSACASVRNLCINIREDLLPLLVEPQLQMILRETCAFSPHGIFMSVTHLTVLDFDPREIGIRELAAFPALTHLCFRIVYDPEALHCALSQCAQLEVLITCKVFESTLEKTCRTLFEFKPGSYSYCDPRFVLMPMTFDEIVKNWESGARARVQGGWDFWKRAEAFVEKKRRGEVKPESRCWIEESDMIPY
ncbi:hypothetical protein FB45DRAFT_141427 [Roridomyces roridus]|uniref:Uncharacterized protein n=1 Tax=Roridomyces roridus TaxID=1738132 RepID=A0AAD7BIB6_9AGAR|nr:hypothetical protein FB45DRAFT_141427 [Roridomyces roridus]